MGEDRPGNLMVPGYLPNRRNLIGTGGIGCILGV